MTSCADRSILKTSGQNYFPVTELPPKSYTRGKFSCKTVEQCILAGSGNRMERQVAGGNFTPPALTEPYVSLSTHAALTMQPFWNCPETALRFARKSFLSVASLPSAAWFTPFAPPPLQEFQHYYGMIRPCGVRWYSMPYGYCPFGTLPLHHSDTFSRSVQWPESQSRHVYAGGR